MGTSSSRERPTAAGSAAAAARSGAACCARAARRSSTPPRRRPRGAAAGDGPAPSAALAHLEAAARREGREVRVRLVGREPPSSSSSSSALCIPIARAERPSPCVTTVPARGAARRSRGVAGAGAPAPSAEPLAAARRRVLVARGDQAGTAVDDSTVESSAGGHRMKVTGIGSPLCLRLITSASNRSCSTSRAPTRSTTSSAAPPCSAAWRRRRSGARSRGRGRSSARARCRAARPTRTDLEPRLRLEHLRERPTTSDSSSCPRNPPLGARRATPRSSGARTAGPS